MKTNIMIIAITIQILSNVNIFSMNPNRPLNHDEQALYTILRRGKNIDTSQINAVLANRQNIDLDALMPNDDGPTYLNIAVRNMNFIAVESLIKNGANVNFRSPITNIAVGSFAYHRRNPGASSDDIDKLCLPIIQAFVQAGFDINSIDKDNETLLHVLAHNGLVQSASYILGSLEENPLPEGIVADTTIMNRYGQTPLQVAERLHGKDSAIYQAISGPVI